jgi:hypothetical protein
LTLSLTKTKKKGKLKAYTVHYSSLLRELFLLLFYLS